MFHPFEILDYTMSTNELLGVLLGCYEVCSFGALQFGDPKCFPDKQ